MNLLAINFNHDGSAALMCDGVITGFVNTERFSRKKKQPGIRECDIDELLGQGGIRIDEIDGALMCNLNNMDSPDIPRLYGTDLKEEWLGFEVDPDQRHVTIRGNRIRCKVNPDHHLLHCALAFYTSPFDSAMVFSSDPVGWASYVGKGHEMRGVQNVPGQFNAPELYSRVAESLFGTGIMGAGKVMGLAPYGFRELDLDYAQLSDVRTTISLYRALRKLGIGRVVVQEDEKAYNASLAYHTQEILDFQLISILKELHEVSVQEGVDPNLCLGGGTALNSVANQKAFSHSPFTDLFLHPACGDDGTTLGAVLWHWHHVMKNPRRNYLNTDLMYTKKCYRSDQVDAVLLSGKYRNHLTVWKHPDPLPTVARMISSGAIVSLFEGGSEIGPRALGHRSIIADPRRLGMRDQLNVKVKHREAFRPFAPAVIQEHSSSWFDLNYSPFMLRVANVLRPKEVPSITHVDGTARIQTVGPNDDQRFRKLLEHFYSMTGVPVLLNTSFNIRGEPIVETPEDAISALLRSEMDCVVFSDCIVQKRDGGDKSASSCVAD